MSVPLISVVIPTANRPQYLPNAVQSALGDLRSTVEVIVVANGPDESWKASLIPFVRDNRVRVESIAQANANEARNRGMAAARGKYLRFLDDDDFLYPDGVLAQIDCIERTNADVCSAPINFITHDGHCLKVEQQPETSDFVSASLCAQRMCQPTAHLFLRQSVSQVIWEPDLAYGQDIRWALKLCQTNELIWVKTNTAAGGWRHHTQRRTSAMSPLHNLYKVLARGIIELVNVLECEQRLTPQRKEAAASGLWDCVHRALFMSPRYWCSIARKAQQMSPGSAPQNLLHDKRWYRAIGLTPMHVELLLAPKRGVSYGLTRCALTWKNWRD